MARMEARNISELRWGYILDHQGGDANFGSGLN
jgi:hypothetical protein